MMKKTFLALTLLLFYPAFCRADALLLKSGETLRGKVLAKNEDGYLFRRDGEEGPVDVPFSNVSIADIDPSSEIGSKPSVILFSSSGRRAAKAKEPENEESSAVASDGLNSVVAIAPSSHVGILKNAEATVALSNARTAQMEKVLEEAKQIADSANQIPAAGSTE